MRIVTCLVLLVLVLGCARVPGMQPSMPSYVGNKYSTRLLRVTVPVAVAGKAGQVRDLHITLDAIINPTKDTPFTVLDVKGILNRSESRISAKVVEAIVANPVLDVAKMAELRIRIMTAAQTALDEAYSKWKYADAFQVEIVVTSLSLSDVAVYH